MSTASKLTISSTFEVAHRSVVLKNQHPRLAQEIERAHEVSPVLARVLAARGYRAGSKELEDFLNPTLKNSLPAPGGLKNLDRACEVITGTLARGEGIAICCDFDVDGLSGGAQLHHFLKEAGGSSKVFVPDRFSDGYGLNLGMVEEIARLGFKLLIAIDYGTTNERELDRAKELGLATIVVDHHHVGEHHCPADVFINPHQEGCEFKPEQLCAAGLVWYLLVGLRKHLKGKAAIDPKAYLDLAALGTICDMVPLLRANRVIAKRGLELLANTERTGLKALKGVVGIDGEVSCYDVGFGIGPRLNAAGRMVTGDIVIDLLTTGDSNKAKRIAQRLNRLNAQRQDTEADVKEQAVRILEKAGKLPAALVVWDPGFHTGVVGIVAQRLVEMFYRPAVVLGRDREGIYKGSVRGIEGFSVVDALAAVSDLLEKFGGHEAAGGLSLKEDRLDRFAKAFVSTSKSQIIEKGISVIPQAKADAEVEVRELSSALIDELQSLAPFGMGNPGPVLLARDLEVQDIKKLKDAHLKVLFSDGKDFLTGVFWRCVEHPALVVGNKVDAAFKPGINKYRGITEIQANIQAVTDVV